MKVKNTTSLQTEMIYEFPKTLLEKEIRNQKSITDELYKLTEIEYVNMVVQNDEISG